MRIVNVLRSFTYIIAFLVIFSVAVSAQDVPVWARYEQQLTSGKDYENPVYNATLSVTLTSPTGRISKIMGFWDGGRSWRFRFMPDETGDWTWTSECSDAADTGLHQKRGSFRCVNNNSQLAIYKNGAIRRRPGVYHLEHADGTPFFWAACTAWNGALKSTDEEWAYYLNHRVKNNYNTIQFVTTQWRGGDKNSLGQIAFEGSGLISINPEFFAHLDKKINEINEAGLVAAPVLLWALQTSRGRHLSPGYHLPDDEAILLAKYMVARYGAHHVVWLLGGDGKYIDNYEQRWKTIGRGVFAEDHPAPVALHPQGKSWIGDAYSEETWLDLIGYQTGHNNSEATVNWITKGPVATRWQHLPPKPFINMEPVYEEIGRDITAKDVRNASYWSLLSTPVSGITYGANGIWPWLREGETILNHAGTGENNSRWRQSLDLPGSLQIGYLSKFFQTLNWWTLKPAPHLLKTQPVESDPRKFISVAQSDDGKTIVAYVPTAGTIELYRRGNSRYDVTVFDPVTQKTSLVSADQLPGLMRIQINGSSDAVLVIKVVN